MRFPVISSPVISVCATAFCPMFNKRIMMVNDEQVRDYVTSHGVI